MSFQDKLLDSFIAFEQVIDLENPIHTDRKNALKRFESKGFPTKKDELWKEAKTQGEARVKLTLILSKIAEQEKVEVTNEDLARAATQEAMMMRKDPTAYIKELSKDRRQLQRLRQDILHDKTLNLVVEKAKESPAAIEEVPSK